MARKMNPNSLANLELGKWKEGQSGNAKGAQKGQPYSIVNAMKKLWSSDGVMTLPANLIIEQTDEYIKIRLPHTDQIALRVAKIIHSKNENAAMNAIKFATSYMDGMPEQNINANITQRPVDIMAKLAESGELDD